MDPSKQDVTWISIHGGSFVMGDANLTLSKPTLQRHVASFKIAKSAVTNDQYAKCVKAGVCTPPQEDGQLPASFKYAEPSPSVWHLLPCLCREATTKGRCPKDWTVRRYATWQAPGRGSHPVVCVTHAQAAAYAAWVGGRLPTEAEWEYAAQWWPKLALAAAPVRALYPDKDAAALGRDNPSFPAAVCSFPPTAAGLCDMVGNVYEWQAGSFLPYATSTAASSRSNSSS